MIDQTEQTHSCDCKRLDSIFQQFFNKKHNFITIVSHLFILAQLFLLTLSQNCPSSYNFDYSLKSCVFNYDYLDDNCTEFNFLQCSWTECLEWKKVDNRSVSQRSRTQSQNTWSECTDTCCDSSVVYPYSYDSINQCQVYLQLQDEFGVLILGLCIGGVGILIALCYVHKNYHILKNKIYSLGLFKKKMEQNEQSSLQNDLNATQTPTSQDSQTPKPTPS